MKTEIVLKGVSKTFVSASGDEVVALHDVNTRLGNEEFVSFLGPSGCGKSTLLAILTGLEQPTQGEIDGLADSGRRPGVVFQDSLLFPWRTALQNVLLPAEVDKSSSKTSQKDFDARARELLEMVGLKGFERRYPHELSGGMQQRVAIARGMLMESDLLLFDEPFSALDEFTREQMHVSLENIRQIKPFSAVFVTHNVQEAVFLSDRVCVMSPRPGRIVAEVAIDLPHPRKSELLTDPAFHREVLKVRAELDSHWTSGELTK